MNRPPANVMFAWELGGGLGHVSKGLLLGERLVDAGCEVSFAVRDLAATHPLLPDARYRLFQAPVSWVRLHGTPEPANHAELLLKAGFGHAAALQGLVRGWLTLFEADKTDLVIADHAPSALLAARCAGLPAVLFGHGFFAPSSDWPVFRTWEPVPAARVSHANNQVLAGINACLAAFGAAPMARAADLFDTAPSYLCTVPALDHYPDRQQPLAMHVGTVWVDQVGEPARWPGGDSDTRPRVFAYLRPDLPGLDEVLAALSNSGASVLIVSPGIAAETAARWQSERLVLSARLVRLDDVARAADLVVCSGSDTLHGMALCGVPVLGLPMNAEQRIAAERVAATGAGRWLLPGSSAERIGEALRDALSSPTIRQAAQALQRRYARQSVDAQLAPVVAACLRMARVTDPS